MAKSFRELEARMSVASLARTRELAKRLKVRQATISKLERRADMYVSTLRDVISALGGELKITARFPEGEVRIKQFDLDSAA